MPQILRAGKLAAIVKKPFAAPKACLTPALTVLLSFTVAEVFSAPPLDRSRARDEVSYRPEDGATVAANPPAFVWLPAEGVSRWIVQYSPSAQFPSDATTTVEGIDMTVHIPEETLEPGTWHWRYGYGGAEGPVFSRTRRFIVPEEAVSFPFPGIDRLLQQIPRSRPRVYFTAETVAEMRGNGDGLAWLVDPVVRQAEAVLRREEPLF